MKEFHAWLNAIVHLRVVAREKFQKDITVQYVNTIFA
jgi:hypothetical protein